MAETTRKDKDETNNDCNSSASCGTPSSGEVDLSGPRKHTSIRVNAQNWAWFVKYCQKTGSSTCRHIDGYILGLKKALEGCASPTTTIERVDVHVHPVREIRRHRRVMHEVEEITESQFSGVAFGECFRCGVSWCELFRVRFVSGLEADLCRDCLNAEKRRSVVKAVLGSGVSDRACLNDTGERLLPLERASQQSGSKHQ